MRNGKMRSFRFTDKMQGELKKAAYLMGIPMTQVIALGIKSIYQQALKNEKKE